MGLELDRIGPRAGDRVDEGMGEAKAPVVGHGDLPDHQAPSA
jgi:hypothetical protein